MDTMSRRWSRLAKRKSPLKVDDVRFRFVPEYRTDENGTDVQILTVRAAWPTPADVDTEAYLLPAQSDFLEGYLVTRIGFRELSHDAPMRRAALVSFAQEYDFERHVPLIPDGDEIILYRPLHTGVNPVDALQDFLHAPVFISKRLDQDD